MKHIVITGGSRGIGFGLASEFLKAGQKVTISGRNATSLEDAVNKLKEITQKDSIDGFVCDVSSVADINKLWDNAAAISPVDIWINNAGINHDTRIFHELEMEKIQEVIETNINGTVIASNIVIRNMLKQGFGSLFNMEGFGSDGRKIRGMSIYGMSKRAIRYFTKSIAAEYGKSDIIIGSISPGMVVTDMILEPLKTNPETHHSAIKIFNILADNVETVTPWLVKRILENRKQGVHIAWLTNRKIALRFFANLFIKRHVPGLPSVSQKN